MYCILPENNFSVGEVYIIQRFFSLLFSFSGFIEDNPDGKLTKVKMMNMYTAVLSVKKATIFVEQIFTKFDTDCNGTIDFKVRTKKVVKSRRKTGL